MEYLLLIASDQTSAIAPGMPGFEEMMADWIAYNQLLMDGGHFIAGASLQPTGTATTVVKAGAGSSLIDGPFAETKEQLGGFYLIRAADLDEALALAERMPIPYASIEVRPIAQRPDA